MGLSTPFFYGVGHGSIVWVLQVGLGLGLPVYSFGASWVGYRLLWFWVFGWPRRVCMVRKCKWSPLTSLGVSKLHSVPAYSLALSKGLQTL